MKKTVLFLMVLFMASVVFVHADSPVEGAYIGGDFTGVMTGEEAPVAGLLLQVSPTDLPFDTYLGVGITDLYVKGGLVLTPWEFALVPIGMYAGGGIAIDPMTSGELVETFSGVKAMGIGEVGLVVLFTEYAQLRVGYEHYAGDNAVNIGMVFGYNNKGLGKFKEVSE